MRRKLKLLRQLVCIRSGNTLEVLRRSSQLTAWVYPNGSPGFRRGQKEAPKRSGEFEGEKHICQLVFPFGFEEPVLLVQEFGREEGVG